MRFVQNFAYYGKNGFVFDKKEGCWYARIDIHLIHQYKKHTTTFTIRYKKDGWDFKEEEIIPYHFYKKMPKRKRERIKTEILTSLFLEKAERDILEKEQNMKNPEVTSVTLIKERNKQGLIRVEARTREAAGVFKLGINYSKRKKKYQLKEYTYEAFFQTNYKVVRNFEEALVEEVIKFPSVKEYFKE